MSGAEMSNSVTVLPCGCQFSTVDDAFVYNPCALDCRYYLYAIDEMKKQGMPVVTLDL